MTKDAFERIVCSVVAFIMMMMLVYAVYVGNEREKYCAVLEQEARETAREWYEDEYVPAKRDGRIPRTQREWLAEKSVKAAR